MMKQKFHFSCESTVDMPFEYVNKRGASVLFYSYAVDGKEYVDDMLRNENALPEFYRLIMDGKLPTTSQINKFKYLEYFDKLLQNGDVLHIAFGSGMTPSVKNALEAKEELSVKYPERRLVIVDSTCSSSGYGLLVDDALDMWEYGYELDELEDWANSIKLNVHHQFFSTDMKMFKRSGRVSGATAMVATILGICPLMRLNKAGKIISYSRARGKEKAMNETIRTMENKAIDGISYSGKCFISHSSMYDDAIRMKNKILEKFPNIKEVKVFDIGTIIASHTGPGTIALFYYGDERIE